MKYDNLTPTTINNIAQNKPVLVASDLLEYGIPIDVTLKILLARGVFKWLAVRRSIIKLKCLWRTKITETCSKIIESKQEDTYRLGYWRGYLKALEECRKEVRTLCHSTRWQAPDFDETAQRFLESLTEQVSAPEKKIKIITKEDYLNSLGGS